MTVCRDSKHTPDNPVNVAFVEANPVLWLLYKLNSMAVLWS